MGSSINDYSIHAPERIENDRAAQEQAELSIEFLQGLIRQSLAEFIAAMFPQTSYRQALTLVHRSVAVRTPTLSIDTLAIAEDVLSGTSAEWRTQIKDTSGKLFACTEKTVAGFLQHLEAQKGHPLSATNILTNAGIDLGILERYGGSRDVLESAISTEKPIHKDLSVPLEGRTWTISINGYPGTALNALSKKEELLVIVKKKMDLLQHGLTPRLRDMAGEIKKRGAKSALSFEVKPFLKGAVEKFKFVEALAKNTFQRITEHGLSESSAEQMLQALDMELQSLERYIFKLEMIFTKAARRPFTAEDLDRPSGMKLSEEDSALLSRLLDANGAGDPTDSIRQALADMPAEDTLQLDRRTFNRDIDWSIKERPAEPGILQDASASIDEKTVSPGIQNDRKRPNLFARIFGSLLDPKKAFESPQHHIITTDQEPRMQDRSKKNVGSVDILLPSFDHTNRAGQQQHSRKVYHHRPMF